MQGMQYKRCESPLNGKAGAEAPWSGLEEKMPAPLGKDIYTPNESAIQEIIVDLYTSFSFRNFRNFKFV